MLHKVVAIEIRNNLLISVSYYVVARRIDNSIETFGDCLSQFGQCK